MTITDFFQIGIRTNAFTVVSLEVAKFPEYVHPMVDHLIALKFNHVDSQVRELTGIALGKLVDFDSDYLQKIMVEKLIPVAASIHSPTAHGAIISICRIIRRLYELEKLALTTEQTSSLRNLVIKILRKQFMELPLGHILLREAVSTFIKTCAEIK